MTLVKSPERDQRAWHVPGFGGCAASYFWPTRHDPRSLAACLRLYSRIVAFLVHPIAGTRGRPMSEQVYVG